MRSFDYTDHRIGQIKKFDFSTNNIKESLMGSITKNCRTAVRRAIKNNITFEHSTDFRPLIEMHREGMIAKNGIIKPNPFFESIPKLMSGLYDLTYAKKQDTLIAGLLIFKFKNIIEYFTPAHFQDYAIEQGTSFLIFNSMLNGMQDEVTYWKFGGTGAP